jgi:hypothetical protein
MHHEGAIDSLAARKLVGAILSERAEAGTSAKTAAQSLRVGKEAAAESRRVTRVHSDGIVTILPRNIGQLGADSGRGLIPTQLHKLTRSWLRELLRRSG